jgi:hypothetical protein
MVIKYIYPIAINFPLYLLPRLSKYTQIGIFGMQIFCMATLLQLLVIDRE